MVSRRTGGLNTLYLGTVYNIEGLKVPASSRSLQRPYKSLPRTRIKDIEADVASLIQGKRQVKVDK